MFRYLPLILLGFTLFFTCNSRSPELPSFCTEQYVGQLIEARDSLFDLPTSTTSIHAIDSIVEKGRSCLRHWNPTELANSYRLLGLLHYDLDNYNAALAQYRKGLMAQPEKNMRGRIYCNIGLVYHAEQQFDEAIVHFDSARWEVGNDPLALFYLVSTTYAADAYVRLGQYSVARQYLVEALQHLETTAQDTLAYYKGECYLYLSDCYRHLKRYKDAIHTAEKGLALHSEDQDSTEMVFFYKNLGNAWQDSMLWNQKRNWPYLSVGREAEKYYQKALSIDRELENIDRELKTRLNLGELYRRMQDYSAALAVLDSGINMLPDSTKTVIASQLYLNRGETHLDLGQLEKASRDFNHSLDHLSLQQGELEDGQLPAISGPVASPQTLLLLLADIASLKTKEGSFSAALSTYDSLINFSGLWRENLLTEEDKFFLVRNLRAPLAEAFSLSLQLSDSKRDEAYRRKAFQYAEQQKMVTLLEQVRFQSFINRLSDEQRAVFRSVRLEQNRIKKAVLGRTSKNRAALRQDWNVNLSRLRQIKEEIYAAFPVELKSESLSKSYPLEYLQQYIAPDQALLEYHLQDSQLFIFCLRQDTLILGKEFVTAAFYKDILQLDQLLSAPIGGKLAEREQSFCSASFRLYSKLIKPIESALPRRLIIIPDQAFLNLPFEALWTKPQKGGFSAPGTIDGYLLYKHAISYNYSGNLFLEMQGASDGDKQLKLAAFAAHFPEEPLKAGKATPIPLVATLPSLTRLSNEEEVESIKKKIAVQPYYRKKANKRQFLLASQKYAVLHLAGHGVWLEDTPALNFISFSQLSDTLELEELLFLQDLYGEPLNLDLVCFSACQTARGTFIEGEGNLSMTRGLATAGVKSIITTLYNVYPQNNRYLFPEFYQYLAQGMMRDEALAEAKKAFIARSVARWDPSHWAGIILIGNSDVLKLKT